MNQHWISFLTAQGHQLVSYEEVARLSAAKDDGQTGTGAFTALSHCALLEVKGPDSEKFLQGQLTCDVAMVTTSNSAPGAACTPQGRVYSNFQLIRVADDPEQQFLLRMHAGLIDTTRDTLGKYAVFFKSEITPGTENFAGIGIWPEDNAAALTQVFGALPDEANRISVADNQILIKLPGRTSRFEYWGPVDAAQALWQELEKCTPVRATSDWELDDIRAGIAHVAPETRESFTPHMLNYKTLGAISFDKGCYTGQEIVARTEYRGQAKRALHHLVLQGEIAITPGTQLSLDGKAATVITAAGTEHASTELLVVAPPEFGRDQDIGVEFEGQQFAASISAFA